MADRWANGNGGSALDEYKARHKEITLRATRGIAALKSLFPDDIVPPSTSSGTLWHFRIVAAAAGWLAGAVLLAALSVSYWLPRVASTDSAGLSIGIATPVPCSFEVDATVAMVVTLAVMVSVFFCWNQGWTFWRLREATMRLEHAVPLPQPNELAAMACFNLETEPLMVDPSLMESGYVCPQPWCGCGPQPGGNYTMDGYGWRQPHTASYLMWEYYWNRLLKHERLWTCRHLWFMIYGVIQIWDLLLNCAQPGLMRANTLHEDSRFLVIVHGGWFSVTVIVLLGLVQVANCRYLLRNAMGAATAEKEWLCHDITGQEDRPSWHTAIGVTNQVHLGHLNITYSWMSLEAAASMCGAVLVADIARKVAEQTRSMIEFNTQYKFRLKAFAEWDLKKVGLVTRVLQAFFSTALNVEYFGVSYHRSCWWAQLYTVVCVTLTLCTAWGKMISTLRLFGLPDVSMATGYTYPGLYVLQSAQPFPPQFRKIGIRMVMLFIVVVVCSTTGVVALGLHTFIVRCDRTGFSLLESIHTGKLQCWRDNQLAVAQEAVAWSSVSYCRWSLLSVFLVFGWVWLAYWGCCSMACLTPRAWARPAIQLGGRLEQALPSISSQTWFADKPPEGETPPNA